MNRAVAYIWGTIVVLLLWWLLAVCVNSAALPGPVETIPVVAQNLSTLMPEFVVSFWRLLIAMLFGTLLGAPIGLLIGCSKTADKWVAPILYVLYPIPKIVFLPVLFIFFGIGGQSKIILIAIAVFFQMIITMRDAAKAIPQSLFVAVKSLGASKVQLFFTVVIRATLPSLFNALRISTATAVAILFIAESMAGSTGLGYYIMHSWSLLNYSEMFAGIVAMAIMGVIFYEAFDLAEKRTGAERSSS